MAIILETALGARIFVQGDFALIGRDPACQIALPHEIGLQPVHAKVRKIANRWIVESQGDWHIQVGVGAPGRMSWLRQGDVIRLTERGPELIFHETSAQAQEGLPASPPSADQLQEKSKEPPRLSQQARREPPPLPQRRKLPPPLPPRT